MNETFNLPVVYKNEELSYKSRLLKMGYTHKFEVQIGGDVIFFELDEERNYRAITDQYNSVASKVIEVELLKQIATTLKGLIQ